MKTDKTKLLQDIEAMKEKLASMEEELNKPEEFKHFPSKGEVYYFYTSSKGAICSNIASDNDLKVKVFKTRAEAYKAYNKEVAIEKIKRRILELQGDWKPNFNDTFSKHIIAYNYYKGHFEYAEWKRINHLTLIPYIKTSKIAITIINEMEDELKIIFNIT